MTLQNPPTWIGGGHHQPEDDRALLRDLARDNEGIASLADLKVIATGSAAQGVKVLSGSAFILGRESPDQGAYHVVNTYGGHFVVVPATGGAARTDTLALQIVDPDYGGAATPDTDAARFVLLSGQADIPRVGGIPSASMIPLARITIPAGTSVVTDAMITDLRFLANARRLRSLLFAYPTGASTNAAQDAWEDWPNAASWQVAIPIYASRLLVVAHLTGLLHETGNVDGRFRVNLGGEVTQTVAYNENWTGSANRVDKTVAGQIDIPDGMRGTTQTLKLQNMRTVTTGKLTADNVSTVVADTEWVERPV